MQTLGVFDPAARGLGIGAAARGLGTAGISAEKDAFPFAAIAIIDSFSLHSTCFGTNC